MSECGRGQMRSCAQTWSLREAIPPGRARCRRSRPQAYQGRRSVRRTWPQPACRTSANAGRSAPRPRGSHRTCWRKRSGSLSFLRDELAGQLNGGPERQLMRGPENGHRERAVDPVKFQVEVEGVAFLPWRFEDAPRHQQAVIGDHHEAEQENEPKNRRLRPWTDRDPIEQAVANPCGPRHEVSELAHLG